MFIIKILNNLCPKVMRLIVKKKHHYGMKHLKVVKFLSRNLKNIMLMLFKLREGKNKMTLEDFREVQVGIHKK